MSDNLTARKGEDTILRQNFAQDTPEVFQQAPAMVKRRKAPKAPSRLQVEVSQRLRAVQQEMGKTDQEMADLLGLGSRSTWTNWTNKENLPAEEAMVRLCSAAHINMDWLYRGESSHLPLTQAIRLTARVLGLDPDEACPAAMARVAATLVA